MTEHPSLTEREIEILKHVATGASNRQIAQLLGISANTVKVHLRNIFEKTGAASRTEATLYAIQQGWVAGVSGHSGTDKSPWWQQTRFIVFSVALFVVSVIAIALIISRLSSTVDDGLDMASLELERWQELAPMPTARKGFAVAAYDGKIYAIAGMTASSVTGVVERYDPQENDWEIMQTDKSIPVDGVEASIVGGKIYIPGGRTQSGQIAEVLEVFDPANDVWEQREPLPIPLTDYALTSHEGKLYLFGGWDGNRVLESTFVYDPDEDQWRTGEDMPSPRAGATAVNTSMGIFVMGGWDDGGILDVSELYQPARESPGSSAWEEASSMPIRLMNVKAQSFGDIIYLLGADPLEKDLQLLEYLPQNDSWQRLASPFEDPWLDYQVVGSGSELHILGGKENDVVSDRHVRFKALYTILIPILQ
jgi:DNA-binding CsgD family transcriptional regulator